MKKQDLVSQVAKTTGIKQFLVQVVIDEATEAIKQAVERGDKVTLRGFGTFFPMFAADRMARNIGKGVKMQVPAHYKPKFRPGNEFKKRVLHLLHQHQPHRKL